MHLESICAKFQTRRITSFRDTVRYCYPASPIGCPKYGTSSKAKRVVRPSEIVPIPDSSHKSVAVVIGAMAHDSCDPDYVDETVSFSRYPLSAALVCAKLTSAFEEAWDVH